MSAESLFITRLFKNGTGLVLTIPQSILRGYKWERGDYLIFGFAPNEQLYLRKLTGKELADLKPKIIHYD